MQEIFSSKERSTRLDRGDKRLMWALTLIYTVFTLLNLGTLSFPTSVWTAQSGAAVRIDLGAEYDVAEIWTNGNIAEGSAVFTGTTAPRRSIRRNTRPCLPGARRPPPCTRGI